MPALPFVGGPDVENAQIGRFEPAAHPVGVDDHVGSGANSQTARAGRRRRRRRRTPLRLPQFDPAVEQRGVAAVSDRGERHVHPAGRHRAVAVEHDVRAVLGASTGQRSRKYVGRRQTVFGTDRRHVIDVPRAGDVRAIVVGAVADEDHADGRIVEVRLQPLRGHQRVDGRGCQESQNLQHALLLIV